jgi:C-terminal binding protein
MPLYICLDSSDGDIEREILGDACEVRMLGATATCSPPEDALRTCDVAAVWHTIRVDKALMLKMPRCRAIVRMGVGYDNVDTIAAGALGLAVCNVPDYGTEEVADTTIAHILGLYRGIQAGAALLERGESFRGPDAIASAIPYIRRVRGTKLGLVGLGRIGSAVALRAKACGFDVSFFDPYREVLLPPPMLLVPMPSHRTFCSLPRSDPPRHTIAGRCRQGARHPT